MAPPVQSRWVQLVWPKWLPYVLRNGKKSEDLLIVVFIDNDLACCLPLDLGCAVYIRGQKSLQVYNSELYICILMGTLMDY